MIDTKEYLFISVLRCIFRKNHPLIDSSCEFKLLEGIRALFVIMKIHLDSGLIQNVEYFDYEFVNDQFMKHL